MDKKLLGEKTQELIVASVEMAKELIDKDESHLTEAEKRFLKAVDELGELF